MGRPNKTHTVPQMMIRRFAGSDGKLVELVKPELSLGTRRRSPKGIMFKNDHYRDFIADLDEELLKPIEQKFAKYCPLMADEVKAKLIPPDRGSAFIEWVAAMLVRTDAFVSFFHAVADKMEDGFEKLLYRRFRKEMQNDARTFMFHDFVDLLTRENYRWKALNFPSNVCVVLTDNPVCQTNGLGIGGQVTIVPLSKHRVMFGGQKEAIDEMRNISIGELNHFLAGWSERRSLRLTDQRSKVSCGIFLGRRITARQLAVHFSVLWNASSNAINYLKRLMAGGNSIWSRTVEPVSINSHGAAVHLLAGKSILVDAAASNDHFKPQAASSEIHHRRNSPAV